MASHYTSVTMFYAQCLSVTMEIIIRNFYILHTQCTLSERSNYTGP